MSPFPLKRPKSGWMGRDYGSETEGASEGVRISFSCCPPSFFLQKTPNGDGLTRRQMGQEGRWRAQITKTDGGEIYVFRLRCAHCCKHFTVLLECPQVGDFRPRSDFGIAQDKLLITNIRVRHIIHLIPSISSALFLFSTH